MSSVTSRSATACRKLSSAASGLCLLERKAPERPEEAHLGIGVGRFIDSRRQLADDGTGPLELAQIGERVAQIGAVPDPRADVLGLGSRDLLERALEEPDRVARSSRRRVRAA